MKTSNVAQRYSIWASAPRKTPEEIERAALFWDFYCDARDGLSDGATARLREAAQEAKRRRPHNAANAMRADLGMSVI